MLHTVGQFYAMAVTVGLVQGGVQSPLARALRQFVPTVNRPSTIGFYNMTASSAPCSGR